MVAATRFLLLCAVWLPLTLLVPVKAFAYGEALAVSPLWGPTGRTVTAIGTGWQDHASRGWDVPIWIGFANEVARGHPDASGKFSVSLTIPLTPPPEEFIDGKLRISAIIGNGGSADAFYTVSNTPLPGCVDAYFIGLHGTGEGPDSQNQNLTLSQAVGETWENFYAFAAKLGKNATGYALDYPGSIADLFKGAVDPGVERLDGYIRDEVLNICPTQSIVLAGYSLGAWIIGDWLRRNEDVWPNIVAVELYGDPLWHRTGHAHLGGSEMVTYDGAARRLGLHLGIPPDRPDPYTDTQQGPIGVSNRWQSRCLFRDPVCGEGYTQGEWDNGGQQADIISCDVTFCEHQKYALSPRVDRVRLGYGLTARGAGFLAMKAFPDLLTPADTRPKIVLAETFREEEESFVFFRLFYIDPNNDAEGFGFRGAQWAEEELPFSSPSFGRVAPGRIEYPFNHGCGTGAEFESDVEAWIYDRAGQRSQSLTVHLACSAPSEVVTPYPAASSSLAR